jgi:hypothetical protein
MNAHLISAAPDLYACAKDAIERIRFSMFQNQPVPEDELRGIDVLKPYFAALDKADGRTTVETKGPAEAECI